MVLAVALGVAVVGVADVGGVVGADALPLVHPLGQVDGGLGGGGGDGAGALELTDEIDQLVVVMILQGALGGLDVAGELVDVLIGEGVLHGSGVALVLGPLLIAACDPLVPARDEDHLGVHLQGVLPLLGEVVAPLGGLGALHLEAVLIVGGVGAARDVVAAHGGQEVMLVIMVLGGTHGHLLHVACLLLLGVLVVDLLGVHGEPAPGGVFGLLHKVAGLTGAEGEEGGDLLVGERGGGVEAVTHGHEHGLAVPVEPQLGPFVLAEDVQVEHLHLGAGVPLIPEGEHEGDLGSLHAVGHGIRPGIHEGGIGVTPGVDSVGVVGEDHVHTRVGQQLALLALDPAVIAAVVAVDGGIPEVDGAAQLGPEGVIEVPHGLGVFGGQLLHIDGGALGGAAGVPGPVEHGQGLVGLGVAHLGVGQGDAAQTVGEDPGIGHDLVGVDEAVRGDDVGVGGLVVAVGKVAVTHAGSKVVLGLVGEVEAEVGEDVQGAADKAVGIQLTLKARGVGVDVETGDGVELVDQEQVISRGELPEGDLGVEVILQSDPPRAHGLLGDGGGIGALPLVGRHGHFHIVAVVGAELDLHAREGDQGVQTQADALVDLVDLHALGGIKGLHLIEHILGALALAEGILHSLGEADEELGLADLLHAVQVQKALGVLGEGIGPYTRVEAGVGDVEEVLARRLGGKLHPVARSVPHGVEGLGGDGSPCHGVLEGSLPLVEMEGTDRVGLLPGGHIDAEGSEGMLDICAVGVGLAYADGLSFTRTVLDGMLLFGSGGDRKGQDGRQRGEDHEQAQNQSQRALERKPLHGASSFSLDTIIIQEKGFSVNRCGRNSAFCQKTHPAV